MPINLEWRWRCFRNSSLCRRIAAWLRVRRILLSRTLTTITRHSHSPLIPSTFSLQKKNKKKEKEKDLVAAQGHTLTAGFLIIGDEPSLVSMTYTYVYEMQAVWSYYWFSVSEIEDSYKRENPHKLENGRNNHDLKSIHFRIHHNCLPLSIRSVYSVSFDPGQYTSTSL